MYYKNLLPENTSYSGITQLGNKTYSFGKNMVHSANAIKLYNKLQGACTRIREFRGAVIKCLRHYVVPTLVGDTPDAVIIHRKCNDIRYKNNKDVLVQTAH